MVFFLKLICTCVFLDSKSELSDKEIPAAFLQDQHKFPTQHKPGEPEGIEIFFFFLNLEFFLHEFF